MNPLWLIGMHWVVFATQVATYVDTGKPVWLAMTVVWLLVSLARTAMWMGGLR